MLRGKIKMELRQIFDTDLLLHLENVVFHSGVTWCFNSSGSHYDENIGGKFECFACPFYNLENHFDRYKEIEDACIKMHEERNTKWSKEHSKLLLYPSSYDGIMHIDNDSKTPKITTITFLNSDWKHTWGGEILCYSDDYKVVVGGVTPQFGKTFLFNGCMPHRALAPIRLSSLLRAVLVTKEK
jgi:hypothetical protein|tara:strand:- start:350 stop:901 length:552 start_codon:yes stop_codon:yes gene_type:complete